MVAHQRIERRQKRIVRLLRLLFFQALSSCVASPWLISAFRTTADPIRARQYHSQHNHNKNAEHNFLHYSHPKSVTTSTQNVPQIFESIAETTTLAYQTKDAQSTSSTGAGSTTPSPSLPALQAPLSSTTRTTTTTNKNSGGWIGTDQLNHLKESVDILDVIEAYNLDQFERKGKDRAVAICPFHDDHNPSLHVDRSRRMYKCFACGEGGDIFRFVLQMEKLQGNDVSFYDAVRKVQQDFAQDSAFSSDTSRISSGKENSPRWSPEQLERQQRRQERIYQANAAAAAFYSKALTWPRAGAARTLLSERHIPPITTRVFALGYAPDAYYGPAQFDATATTIAGATTAKPWGAGSLVENLRALNFTAEEILSSGLAVQTKRAANLPQVLSGEGGDDYNHTEGYDTTAVSFDSLMDRFRGRIVIPIFDATGKRVVGFGGRILHVDQDVELFVQPKYLNSPESPVFQKKSILFGHHLLNESPWNKFAKKGNDGGNVILVEGYMDAISLYSVGISNVVATMGTAVSSDQLLLAARAAHRREGSLILCLDSDDAGMAAIERLCSNGIMADVLSKCSVSVQIATLPYGIKDPGEYVESKLTLGASRESVATEFKASTLDTAVHWMDWYIAKILRTHSVNATVEEAGSLRFIIDRLADFLTTIPSQSERETKAAKMAVSLTDLVARTSNVTSVSDTVRNQLELDLLQMAANKALMENAAKVGGEYGDASNVVGAGKNRLTAALSRGHGPRSSDRLGKLSLNKLNHLTLHENDLPATTVTTKVYRQEAEKTTVPNKEPRSNFKVKRRQSPRAKPDFIPHFSGFTFKNKADAEWLGLNKRGANLVLGLDRKPNRFSQGDDLYPESKKPVFFNSNDFFGQQFISDEAVEVGYSREGIVRDPDIAYKGVAFLVKANANTLQSTAEDELLSLLVRNSPARLSVKNWLDHRRAVHSEIGFTWTSKEKEWLFSSLVEDFSSIPPDLTGPSALRSHLACREDVPCNAFLSKDESVTELTSGNIEGGLLEHYFLVRPVTSTVDAQLGDAHAQELLASLIWSSRANQAQSIKNQLDEFVKALDRLPPAKDNAIAADENQITSQSCHSDMLARSHLESQCVALMQDYWHVQRSLRSLTESTNRVRQRVLDETGARWRSQQLSLAEQKSLQKEMEDFVVNYKPPPTPPELESILKLDDSDDDSEPYEDTLERLDREWSFWLGNENGSVDIEPTNRSPILDASYHLDDDVDETLEEALSRLEKDWGRTTDGEI